jgi:Putative DNA-binding domain
MLFDIPLDSINESHLQSLVNSVPEGRQIEYKLQLPSSLDQDVVEFLKDVTAMANTLGGDILYGVREGKDASGNTLAMSIDGVSGEDADKVKQRLESFIRDNVRPRLIGHRIEPVKLSNGNQVFIVRLPRSWNAPHVIEYKKHWRFYYRNSAGSHPMDVTELRNAFLLADATSQRLEEFRLERLAKIASDETIGKGAKVVLHIQSLNSIDPAATIAIAQASSLRRSEFLSEYYGGIHQRINFDGYLVSAAGNGQRYYFQVFRTGKIESVSPNLIRDNIIVIKRFEERLIKATRTYLTILKELGAATPLMLNLSLLGVKDYKLKTEVYAATARADQSPIDRDDLLLPGQLIQSFEEQPEKILHSSFNAVWNAAGFDESLNYDENENWTGMY